MKKYILLVAVVFIGCNCFGQFKIGSISMDEQTFKDYVADCYLHPDTVKDINPYDGLCNGCMVDVNRQDEKERRAKEFNDNLRKNNIGLVTDTVYFPAGNDTLLESDLQLSGETSKKSRSKIVKIFKHDAGNDVNYIGFLMPRKPSEEDFIKWYKKNKL